MPSWTKKLSRGIHKGFDAVSSGVQKVAGKNVANVVDKSLKYAAWPTSAAHAAAHLAKDAEDYLNPKYPTVEAPTVDMSGVEEAMGAMSEYLAAMQAAMAREEPAQEPLKQAQVEMSEARADTNRKQLLRRGLMSTYTRYGAQGGTQRLGA